MNLGQMLMAAGGLILLSTIFLSVNRTFANSSNVLISTKLDVLAVSLGASFIEDASSKSFDTHTVGNAVDDLDSLTLPASLGPGAGETYPHFDDFDDFDGLSIQDSTTIPGMLFNVDCKVEYVNENDPEIVSTTVTWHKKITVKISSPAMIDTVTLSNVHSYFYFR